MSKMSVFDPGWIDVVFEGRNQSYGAYQLRRDSGKTTMTALFAGILCISGLIAVPAAISYLAAPAQETALPADIDKPLVVTVLPDAPVKPVTPEKPAAAQAAQKSTVPQVELKPLAVVPSTQPTPTVPDQAALTQANPGDHTEAGTPGTAFALGGNGTATGTSPDGTGSAHTATAGTGPVNINALDVQPEFPGGIDKFRQYVADKFDPSSGTQGNLQSVKLYVYFVIEADGTMTGIRTRSTDEALSREAVRVLKSLKTRWRPGKKGGEYVRTAYNLPIVVNLKD